MSTPVRARRLTDDEGQFLLRLVRRRGPPVGRLDEALNTRRPLPFGVGASSADFGLGTSHAVLIRPSVGSIITNNMSRSRRRRNVASRTLACTRSSSCTSLPSDMLGSTCTARMAVWPRPVEHEVHAVVDQRRLHVQLTAGREDGRGGHQQLCSLAHACERPATVNRARSPFSTTAIVRRRICPATGRTACIGPTATDRPSEPRIVRARPGAGSGPGRPTPPRPRSAPAG
jgi:hypothetical protein